MGVDLLDVNLARAAFFQNNDVHTALVIKYTLILNEQKGAKRSKCLQKTDKKTLDPEVVVRECSYMWCL